MSSGDTTEPARSDPLGIAALLETSNYRPFEEATADITGLTDSAGGVGMPGRNDDHLIHMFSFAAWTDGNAMQNKLVLFRPLESEVNDYHAAAPAHTVLHLRVRLSTCRRAAIVEEFLPATDEDPAFARLRHQLQTPVVAQTQLGALTLDRRLNWFCGPTTWGTSTVDLSLDANGDSVSDASLQTALTVWDNQQYWSEAARSKAVEKLLPLKNDGWHDDDDWLQGWRRFFPRRPLTEAKFLSRLTPKALSFTEAGKFSIFYDDGNLFSGHDIEVYCTLEQGAYNAHI